MNTRISSHPIFAALLLGLLALGFAGPAQAVFPDDCPDRDTYRYFPRVAPGSAFCAEETGRMVALAGSSVKSLDTGFVSLEISVPGDQLQWELGIFDGDTGQKDDWPSVDPPASGPEHWDAGTTELSYTLFVDPNRERTIDPLDLVASWQGNATAQPTAGTGWTASPSYLPDNDWWVLIADQIPAAQGLDGNYYFHLVILYDPDPGTPDNPQTISDFRVRGRSSSDGFTNQFDQVGFSTTEFAFEGAQHNVADIQTLYPEWNGVNPPSGSTFWLDEVAAGRTTYDGRWTFLANLPPLASLELYDGDFDYGNDARDFAPGFPSGLPLEPCVRDVTDDTDDPDSFAFPNQEGNPRSDDFPFFVTLVDPLDPNPVGEDNSLPQDAMLLGGDPSDNTVIEANRREPCVTYRLIGPPPDNLVFENVNPSSQREWEQFRICSLSADLPAQCDYTVPETMLPGGTWTVEIEGMDLSNLNTWFFEIEPLQDACLIDVQKTASPTSIASGASVTYTYVVTNNGDPLVDVDLQDDKLGIIAQDFSLAIGESRTFASTTQIFETTTNVATVMGATAFGTMCSDEDTAVVTVEGGGCTLTWGYWKTHSEFGPAPYDDTWAMLPNGASTPFFGTGKTYYEILQTPSRGGNKYIGMAHQYIAAELNVLAGASIPAEVAAGWLEAQALLIQYEGLLNIPKRSPDRARAVQLEYLLDQYNMGNIGPGHCD